MGISFLAGSRVFLAAAIIIRMTVAIRYLKVEIERGLK